MKYLILLLSFCFSSYSYASQSYSGMGMAIFSQSGVEYKCSEIFMRFDLSSSKLKVYEGGYKCDLLQASYDFFSLSIIEGKLYADDEIVGDINDQEMNLYDYDPNDDSHFHLSWRFDSGLIDYNESWFQHGQLKLLVSGTLKLN